jgi:hypothetical protein
MSSFFSNFLAKIKRNHPNFVLERKKEYLKTFPVSVGKRQNLCQAKKKTLELCYRAHDLTNNQTAAHNMHT